MRFRIKKLRKISFVSFFLLILISYGFVFTKPIIATTTSNIIHDTNCTSDLNPPRKLSLEKSSQSNEGKKSIPKVCNHHHCCQHILIDDETEAYPVVLKTVKKDIYCPNHIVLNYVLLENLKPPIS